MHRLLITGILLALVAVSWSVKSESIKVIEAIKITNSHRDEALFYYHNNWQVLRTKALDLGYIQAFELIETSGATNAEIDLFLITEYANQSQFEKSETRFNTIIVQSTGLKLLNSLKPSEFRQSLFVKIGKEVGLNKSLVTQPVKEVVVAGLAHPWSMAFLSEEEVLVSEKDGYLLKINLLTKQKTILENFPEDLAKAITIDASKYTSGIYPSSLNGRTGRFNMGIFDVVLDPDYENNKTVYVAYAAQQGDTFTTKVIRATLLNDSLTDIKTILEANPYSPGAWHFGGGLTFGPDGKLYITIGERLFNEVNQPAMPIAQNLNDNRGKIHRINPDGSIPSDNPNFAGQGVSSIYALGIRAAQGLTVAPNTGRIWFTEHGTHQGDEINLLAAGANYGWPIKTTGRYRHADYQPPALPERIFSQPIWYWQHTVAPTGLTFYTGDEFPQWKNDLFVSGLSRGSLWRVRIDNNKVNAIEALFVDEPVRSRKVVQSPQGKLYLLTDEDNGKIMRIRAAKK